MVDVARSASSLSRPLFDSQASFSDLALSSTYWTEPVWKKSHTSQDSYPSSDSRSLQLANPFSGPQKLTSTDTFVDSGILPQVDMSGGGYPASENTRHGGTALVPAVAELRSQHVSTDPQFRPITDRQESANGGLFVVKHEADKPDFLTPEDSNVRNSGNGIVSYLQLPSTIAESNGSLAEFAAQVR
jgi:hypothetical protein